MRKIKIFYICLMGLLFTMTTFAQIDGGEVTGGYNVPYTQPATPVSTITPQPLVIQPNQLPTAGGIPSIQQPSGSSTPPSSGVGSIPSQGSSGGGLSGGTISIPVGGSGGVNSIPTAPYAGTTPSPPTGGSSGSSSSSSSSSSPPPTKDWYLDSDGDGWHSQTTKASTSPGPKWATTTKGYDCDDNDVTKTNICDPNWYLDNDGDGWHSAVKKASTNPGANYKTTTKGLDCDDTKATVTNECTTKKWYLDNDGDGYHITTAIAGMSPGTGWKEGISKGLDCDDAKGLVWQLNSCGKCKLESNSKEWKVEDILKTDIPLLKEIIDKSKQVAPILKINKSLDLTNMGAFSNTFCQTTTLGGGIGVLDANYTLAFELTHIINRSLQEDNFNAIFNGISRSEYLVKTSKIEAEGFIFSEIVKKEEAKNLNDCEKKKLNMISLKQDYSGKTLAEIKSLIRLNGELDSIAKLLQTTAKSLDNWETLEDNHGGFYDSWKKNILYYRKYYKETDQQIKARFPRCKK